MANIAVHRIDSKPYQAAPTSERNHLAQRLLLAGVVVLVHRDHRVDRQGHRGLADGGIAFAQCTEQGQAEGGQSQGGDEGQRIGEQQADRRRGGGKAQQRQQYRLAAAPPAVIGLGDGAGDDAQEQAGLIWPSYQP